MQLMRIQRHPRGLPPARGARAKGFTLVELVVTVAVAAILALVAVPSMREAINRNRLTSTANEVMSVVQLARMEAIRRNRRVEICPSADGTTCAGAAWSRMIIRVPDDNETVRDVRIPGNGLVVAVSSNVATNHRLAFGGSGVARVGVNDAAAGTISVCSTRMGDAENARDVRVSAVRVSVSRREATTACTAPAN